MTGNEHMYMDSIGFFFGGHVDSLEQVKRTQCLGEIAQSLRSISNCSKASGACPKVIAHSPTGDVKGPVHGAT